MMHVSVFPLSGIQSDLPADEERVRRDGSRRSAVAEGELEVRAVAQPVLPEVACLSGVFRVVARASDEELRRQIATSARSVCIDGGRDSRKAE